VLKAVETIATSTEDGQEETRGQWAAMTAELAGLRRSINAQIANDQTGP
jgi:hypothetical protein